MITEITGLLERVRQGKTTAQDAEAIEALVLVYEKRIRDLEAANRGYWLKHGDPPVVAEVECVQ